MSDPEDTDDIYLDTCPRFYATYLQIAANDTPPDIDPESLLMLRDRGFTKFVIETEDPTVSVKMLSYVMAHSMLKPQRLLVDDDDYYVAVDLFTNTYYICYRDVMMIDVDRYKSPSQKSTETCDTLENIKTKLSAYPDLFFRIYASRNGYHIFVINKSMDYKSDESIRLMSDLGCDFYYMVYSYLRGWSVRLNKKKGEENTDNLYTWVGDVVKGHFFHFDPSDIMSISKIQEEQATLTEKDLQNIDISSIMPDPRLDKLVQVHINLVDVFKDVGLCTMPAP